MSECILHRRTTLQSNRFIFTMANFSHPLSRFAAKNFSKKFFKSDKLCRILAKIVQSFFSTVRARDGKKTLELLKRTRNSRKKTCPILSFSQKVLRKLFSAAIMRNENATVSAGETHFYRLYVIPMRNRVDADIKFTFCKQNLMPGIN